MAEYVWIDGSNGVRSKTKVSGKTFHPPVRRPTSLGPDHRHRGGNSRPRSGHSDLARSPRPYQLNESAPAVRLQAMPRAATRFCARGAGAHASHGQDQSARMRLSPPAKPSFDAAPHRCRARKGAGREAVRTGALLRNTRLDATISQIGRITLLVFCHVCDKRSRACFGFWTISRNSDARHTFEFTGYALSGGHPGLADGVFCTMPTRPLLTSYFACCRL